MLETVKEFAGRLAGYELLLDNRNGGEGSAEKGR